MKLIKSSVLTLMIAVFTIFSVGTAKAHVDVYLNVEEGQYALVKPIGTPRLNNGSYYSQISWGDAAHKGTVSPTFLTNQNLHEFEGVKAGNVAYSVNESTSYGIEARYHIRVHKMATDIVFDNSAGQMSDDHTIWLYVGDKTTLSCTTLPFNIEWENDGNKEYLNAIQGVVVEEYVKYGTPPKGIVKAAGRRPSWKAPSYLDLEGEGEGDAAFGIRTAGSAVPTGITAGTYCTGFNVHVRKKPEIQLSGTKVMTTNKSTQNAISATIKSSGAATCTWTSSNPEILEVIGNGTDAKLISKDKEGKVTITCSVEDEVTKNNRTVKPVSASYEVEVKKADIVLDGIKNGGTLTFDRYKDVMEIPFSEVEGSVINWTSSHDNVVDVKAVNGKLVLTKKGEGESEIIGTSSTGNVFSFKVKVEFVPETPRISKVESSYGKVNFDFEGTLYDRYELECGSSIADLRVIASTKNKFATVELSAGNYVARVRSLKVVDGKNVYSKYSDIVNFTVGKDGNVNVNGKLKKIKIKKVKKSAKKLKITLTKIKGAKYYIKYADNKKFKKAKKKTSKKNVVTIKNLKSKKKYYIKAYYKLNGKVSKWSKVKKVTVK